MKLRSLGPFVAALGVLVSSSCREREGTPILEEPTASAIRDAAGEALQELVDAREALAGTPLSPEGTEALARAEERLKRLTEYYAPLLDARECAYRAYRFYYLEPGRVEGELARVESILQEIARDRGPALESELSEAEDLLAEARTALETESARAPDRLDALARRLSFMLLKGELILM